MDLDNPQTYKTLLIRLISVNVFFVLLMTLISFFALLSYDYQLWQACTKSDILKVFIQNIRFNLSIAAYFNIPVFLFLLTLLFFRPAHIMKFSIGLIKSFYFLSFVTVTSLFTLSYLLKNMSTVSNFVSDDYFSNLSFIYSLFDNSTFIILLIVMSVLFLIIVVFFILFLKFVLTSKEYTVQDHDRAVFSTIITVLVCILLAKGKIIGHLSVKDAMVTPVVQLNEYAVRGPYKLLDDLINYDYSNISVGKKNEVLIDSGYTVLDDNEKALKDLYRFTPKEGS